MDSRVVVLFFRCTVEDNGRPVGRTTPAVVSTASAAASSSSALTSSSVPNVRIKTMPSSIDLETINHLLPIFNTFPDKWKPEFQNDHQPRRIAFREEKGKSRREKGGIFKPWTLIEYTIAWEHLKRGNTAGLPKS